MRYLIFAFIMLMFTGCADSPLRLGMMSEEELKTVDVGHLCNAYGVSHDESVKRELTRRGIFNDVAWEVIDAKKIQIGMTACAVLASWGPPQKINETVSAFGKTQQWIYGIDCRVCKSKTYVYLRNGVVSSWQAF